MHFLVKNNKEGIDMEQNSLEKSIKEMRNWYHKLIYLVDRNPQIKSTIPLLGNFSKINVNKTLSEGLLEIPKSKYPMYVSDILLGTLKDKNEIYILQHIDILFDPQLKIIPTQLFEQISKTYQLIVEWPGKFEDGHLIYAEYGHPEYFNSNDYEGKVFIK